MTAASLLAALLLAGLAHGQSPLPDRVKSQGVERPKQPVPAPLQRMQPVSYQDKEKDKGKDAKDGEGTAKFPTPERYAPQGGQPGNVRGKVGEDEVEFNIQTELPGLNRLTRRISEAQFYESIVQESRSRPGYARVFFPEELPVSQEVYSPRQFPPMVNTVEPHYVCHGLLYFEQPNFERHGWSLGPIQPLVSTAIFYYDLASLPYHYWSRPCQHYDCSSGKCLPGDPTPLLCYREHFSVTGLVGETATILGGFFAFP
jgi:hypothetical protein